MYAMLKVFIDRKVEIRNKTSTVQKYWIDIQHTEQQTIKKSLLRECHYRRFPQEKNGTNFNSSW